MILVQKGLMMTSKTFNAYCTSKQPCRNHGVVCTACELKWYKQRCEELEKGMDEYKTNVWESVQNVSGREIEGLKKQIERMKCCYTCSEDEDSCPSFQNEPFNCPDWEAR